jgi:hypothetical protein
MTPGRLYPEDMAGGLVELNRDVKIRYEPNDNPGTLNIGSYNFSSSGAYRSGSTQ